MNNTTSLKILFKKLNKKKLNQENKQCIILKQTSCLTKTKEKKTIINMIKINSNTIP